MHITEIKLKNGTFFYDELERIFPYAKGERKGDIWYIDFYHPADVSFTEGKLYSWDTICKKMGIKNKVPKHMLNSWSKMYFKGRCFEVLSHISTFFGEDFEDLGNAFREMDKVSAAIGFLPSDTMVFLKASLISRINEKCGSMAAEQIRACLYKKNN